MRALRVRIEGDYWDSILYNDNLMLVTASGSMEVYRWDQVVGLLINRHPDLEVQLHHLLRRGKAWYALGIQDLVAHPASRSSLLAMAEAAASADLVISRRQLAPLRRRVVDVGLFPTTDLECFGNRLFVGSTDGLQTAALTSIEDLELSAQSVFFDGPCLRVAASYKRLAIALGQDGLAETTAVGHPRDPDVSPFSYSMRSISDEWADSCAWAGSDIVATHRGEGGYIGAFSRPSRDEDELDDRLRPDLLETVGSDRIFSTSGGTMVAAGGTVALIQGTAISSRSWNPFRQTDTGHVMDRQGPMTTEPFRNGATLVHADLAVFGVVVEYDERMVVHGTDGKRRSIPGEVVNWRVFPRSERYVNQLHLVKESWLDVHAFHHDYFVPAGRRGVGARRPSASSW